MLGFYYEDIDNVERGHICGHIITLSLCKKPRESIYFLCSIIKGI